MNILKFCSNLNNWFDNFNKLKSKDLAEVIIFANKEIERDNNSDLWAYIREEAKQNLKFQ